MIALTIQSDLKSSKGLNCLLLDESDQETASKKESKSAGSL